MRATILRPVTSLLLFVALAALNGIAASADVAPDLNRLQGIDHGTLPGGRIVIRATFSEPLRQPPAVFRTYHPRLNIALDFAGVADELRDDVRALTFRGVESIDVEQVGHVTRMIVSLDEPRIHDVAVKGRELWLTLTPIETARQERHGWYQHANR